MRVYKNSGHQATVERQMSRRAVESGRAYWLASRPKYVVEVTQPTTPPVKHIRKRFGEGILRSLPSHQLPCTLEDAQWWAEQNAAEEAREIERLAARFEAESRYDGWF